MGWRSWGEAPPFLLDQGKVWDAEGLSTSAKIQGIFWKMEAFAPSLLPEGSGSANAVQEFRLGMEKQP